MVTPPTERTICHVDMDAFFVSVELRRRPELVGKPVVVGGTGRRGVVAAASYEARRYGIRSAMPSVVAQRRCPDAVFLSGDHGLYQRVSSDVRSILDRYTPFVEPLSLDEAFLDVTGSRRLFGTGVEIATSIRAAIATELELRCSVGVAPNKFLAKLASVEAKPRIVDDRRHIGTIEPGAGVVEVVAGEELAFLDPLPAGRLWGVGPKTLERLERLGVRTVRDLRDLGEEVLAGALGAGTGAHLFALANGRDDRPVESDQEAKSISHEQTYETNKVTHDELHTELVRQADAVAARVRRADTSARTLSIKVRFEEGFRTITRSITVGRGVATGPEMVRILEPLLVAIDPSPGVRLFGVAASNFGEAAEQLSLETLESFTSDVVGAGSSIDWSAATEAMDAARRRFGDDIIGPAAALGPDKLRLVRRGQQQWGPDSPESSRPASSRPESSRPGSHRPDPSIDEDRDFDRPR